MQLNLLSTKNKTVLLKTNETVLYMKGTVDHWRMKEGHDFLMQKEAASVFWLHDEFVWV